MPDTIPTAPKRQVYLGDGAYAEFRGFDIRVWAPRDGGDHEVFLDPDMMAELERFARQCWPGLYEQERAP